MEYIEAPQKWSRPSSQPSIFLAGGITGCPEWQRELIKLLIDTNFIIFNPRRENFPIDDPEAAQEQIQWEFDRLRDADIISFWFSSEGVQSIVLYELGAWSMTNKRILVGVEPGFWREQDVYVQTQLSRPDVEIVNTLGDLADQIKAFGRAWYGR